jgi:riboflavin kinase/FMN adenylyltransferase
MRTIELNIDSPPAFPEGSVLTQGTFDGIHLGHVQLLHAVIDLAKDHGVPSVLLTFKPHPAKVLRPSRQVPLLTIDEEREKILDEIGLDYLAIFSFNTKLAVLQAKDYVRQVLVGIFGARSVVVGYNHTFGRKREGGERLLEEMRPQYGYDLRVVPPVVFEGLPVHSSRIREDLFDGRFASAVHMLNRPYRVSGTVVRGRGVGKKLGYPTINVRAHADKLIPRPGVYAAKVKVSSDWLPGMMYIGEDRSIFDLEVSIFDFDGDLYDTGVTIDVFDRTRDSVRFESGNKLVTQIAEDEKRIRDILSRI